ncbi:long-chain fatty acid--CoA ligase [Paenibacillus athensensis]|uniref:Uncharacterized protein n=1 Tax=Paenibacillus athensensis TaxID=1967502 RepID=A0A4Y8Q5E3_9BACL|nr:fatty acid--CoA ligase family protein [Paenibacillus athensensis]MCD1259615.1 long-chain fatty acid--CoA ligase [Paenibacillus athensensis]
MAMIIDNRQPERPALRCGGVTVSYGELAGRVAEKRSRLEREAAGASRLAIDLPDSFTLLEWALAAWTLEVCVLVLDQRLTASEKELRLAAFAPDTLVQAAEPPAGGLLALFRHEVADRVAAWAPATADYAAFRREASAAAETAAVDADVAAAGGDVPALNERASAATGAMAGAAGPAAGTSPDRPAQGAVTAQPALVLFSSGSTGLPKMIVRTFASLEREWAHYQLEDGAPGADSRVLCLVPVSHSFGMLSATAATLRQGGLVLYAEDPKPQQLVALMEHEAVTHVYGVAFHYQLLARELERSKPTLSAKPLLLSSGGPLPAELTAKYSETIGLPLGQQYGMSEVGYIAVDFAGSRPGSVGRIAPHIAAARLEDNQLAISLPQSPYATEQLNWCEGAGVETGAGTGTGPFGIDTGTGPSGTLLTQDIVRLDEDGYLYIQGRSNDQVSIGGLKVNLKEVEGELNNHPLVKESCVVAYEHAVAGSVLEAFVVWREPERPGEFSELGQWLRERMADYKVPRRFRALEQIPVSPAGKINKGELIKECLHGSHR